MAFKATAPAPLTEMPVLPAAKASDAAALRARMDASAISQKRLSVKSSLPRLTVYTENLPGLAARICATVWVSPTTSGSSSSWAAVSS